MNRVSNHLLGLLSLMLLTLGCFGGADGPERVVVSGKVTYMGKPVEAGMIRFVPAEGPVAEALIEDGNYSVTHRGGVPVGAQRVEIRGEKVVKAAPIEADGGPEDAVTEQYIPRQYNEDSTLTFDVPPGAKELTKDFDLEK